MTDDLLKDASRLICKDLGLSEANQESSFDYEELLDWLSDKVSDLLLTDFERLVNIMYRLDIHEQAFHAAMALEDHKKISAKLSELIIHRELEKAKFRRQYRE